MTRDELEFSISQYLDGTLAAAERDALEERLATDAEARAVYAEYESLNAAFAVAPALPDIDWDQFAGKISAAVAREELPAQSYKIGPWVGPMRLAAIAASLLVAGGVAFSLLRPGDGTPGGGTQVVREPTRIVAVDPPAPDALANAANSNGSTLHVAIAPPSGDGQPVVLRYADSVVQRPSRAVIVSAAPVAQDTSAAPF
jgi:anti-sigma factor RsiW